MAPSATGVAAFQVIQPLLPLSSRQNTMGQGTSTQSKEGKQTTLCPVPSLEQYRTPSTKSHQPTSSTSTYHFTLFKLIINHCNQAFQMPMTQNAFVLLGGSTQQRPKCQPSRAYTSKAYKSRVIGRAKSQSWAGSSSSSLHHFTVDLSCRF